MRWVAYQSEFAQLSGAVGGGCRTDWANKWECRGPLFAVAPVRDTKVLMMSEEQCCTWHSD